MVFDAALRGLLFCPVCSHVHRSNSLQSLTQTRLHFQNIVAGFTSEDEAALVDWREDFTPRGDAAREKDKGKQRAGDVGVAAATTGSAKKKRRSDGRAVS